MYGISRIDRCKHCGEPIHWMRTCYGNTRLPFEPTPVPKTLDPDRDGWIPGQWTVRGRTRTVLAPLRRYRPEKQAQVVNVVFVHRCAEYEHRTAMIREGLFA